MANTFFEGKDFGKGVFKALTPSFYPPKYQKYVREETALLQKKLQGANTVLEAGVGIGRIIPDLAQCVKNIVGIDIAKHMLVQARRIAEEYPNVEIVECSIEHLPKKYKSESFEYSLCLWNTLGNVDDEVEAIKALKYVTKKSIFVTVYKKETVEDRINWYDTVGIPLERVDRENEIFYSKSGLRSKSYNLDDLKHLASAAGLNIVDHQTLGGVILWVELTADGK